MTELEKVEGANQKLLNQIKCKNEQFRYLVEAHEKLQNSLKLKEKEWDVEKYERDLKEKNLEHMYECLKKEKVKVEVHLKLKISQLSQLEENFELLRNALYVKEKEWGVEKHDYCGEISMLERKLDSEITLSKDVKNRLECCKQALACKENQIMCLQSQLLESKSCNEDIKSKLERLTIEKDGVCKEMECKILQIEEENKELVLAVKNLKDSQIQEAANTSLITDLLQKKFNTLDEIYKGKEAEWTSRLDKLMEEKLLLHDQLVKSSCRVNEVEFELQRWKSVAEKLEAEKAWVTNEKGQMINKLLTEKEKLINMIDDMFQWIDKLVREERQMMGAFEEFSVGF